MGPRTHLVLQPNIVLQDVKRYLATRALLGRFHKAVMFRINNLSPKPVQVFLNELKLRATAHQFVYGHTAHATRGSATTNIDTALSYQGESSSEDETGNHTYGADPWRRATTL